MNRALVFGLVAAAAAFLFISFNGCDQWQDAPAPGIGVPSMDSAHLSLSLETPTPRFAEVETEAGRFTRLGFGDHAFFGEVGAPAIPYFSVPFAIPRDARVELAWEEGASSFLEDVTLFPVQPPSPDDPSTPEPRFAFDERAYEADEFGPESPVFLEEERVLRGLRVNQLWISPVRYNPKRRQLEIMERVNVTIRFSGGGGVFFSDPALRSGAFERIYKRFLVNHAVIEPAPEASAGLSASHKGEGARFLIVTHPDFAEAAHELKIWKLKMGISTEVATTDEIGETTADISRYVADAYHQSATPLEYLLLLGDAEFIPLYYRTRNISDLMKQGTDLYYGCLDGDDIFADIGLGRISVDTPDEALMRIQKIIDYEADPVTDDDYYSNSHHFAYFQDSNDDGVADRRFALTSEEMVRWFSEGLEGSAVTPHRCFAAGDERNPSRWSASPDYHFFADWWTLPTDQIPDELLRENGFDWVCDKTDIAQAINSGTFFLTHRDHGGRSGWVDPNFETPDVQALTNGDLLPVVWTINCMTGWFDNETDPLLAMTASWKINFSEAWERNPNGGAVGIIAPTRTSFSGYNDRLVWGWMDALWPGYIPGYPAADDEESTPAMSDVLNFGKFYLATAYEPGLTRTIEIEEFHWFGDPTMKMWLGAPLPLDVSHESLFWAGASTISVDVAQDGATVTLVAGDRLVAAATSAGGQAVLTLPDPPASLGEMSLTVTLAGHRPYLAEVAFVECVEDEHCSDDIFCNGPESCDQNACVPGEPPDCEDGLFCTGTETCDQAADECVSSGDPCPEDLECDESTDTCNPPGTDDDDDAADDDLSSEASAEDDGGASGGCGW